MPIPTATVFARRPCGLRLPAAAALALLLAGAGVVAAPLVLRAQAPAVAAPRQLGTVKAVAPGSLTLTTAAGTDVTVTLGDAVRVLMGSADLKSTSPAAVSDIAVGDRALVTGQPGDLAGSLTAARVVLMKSGALAARKAGQQQDWQQRGVSGLVRGVAGPEITVGAGARTFKVSTSPATVFRRYAPDSVNFADAQPGKLEDIRTGDQLSVRGAKSADGTGIAAEEIVTGTFENLSGALASVDVQAQTMTLKDLVTKQTVTVHVTPNSDLRKLPPQAAAAFANRNAAPAAGTPATGPQGAPGASARAAGMDLSRMLSHLPTETLADLKPGDAVMIVASRGRGTPVAITLLSGVEQILSARSATGEAVTLQPWSLSVPDGGGQ